MKKVTLKVNIDSNGDPITKFELEGFEGNECESLLELENSFGAIQDRKATDEAFNYDQELPLPNSALG